MPKVSQTPFTYYTFRYDYQDDNEVEKIRKYIIREIPKYAIFIEISSEVEKKHIQGKLGKALSLVQLRKHFKEEFPNMFVKSNYSIGDIKDPEKYDSYICKDGNPLCNNVFEPEYIEEQVLLHKSKVVAFEKKKEKQVTGTFTQKVFHDFCIEFPHDVVSIQHLAYKPSDYEKKQYDNSCKVLLKFILKRLGRAVKVFDDNILQRMYTGIKNSVIQLDDASGEKQFDLYENRIQM